MDKRIEGTFENADLVIEAIHQLRNEEGFSPGQLLVVTRNKEPDTITEQTEVEVVITSEDPEGSLWHKIKNFFTVSLDGEEEEEELLESYGIEEETYERFEDALEKGEYLLLVDDAAPNHPEHADFLVRDGILEEESRSSSEDMAAPQVMGSLTGTRALTDEEQLSPGEAVDTYLGGPDSAVTTAGGTPDKNDQPVSALGAERISEDPAVPQTIGSLSGTRALTDEEQLSPGEAVDTYLDGPDSAVTTAGRTMETETRTVSSLIEEEDGTAGDIPPASLEAEKRSGAVERIVPAQTTEVHQNIQGKEEWDMSEENKKDFPASKEEALKAANQGAHPDPEPAQAQQEDYSGKEIPSSQHPDPASGSSEEEGESSDEEGDRRLSRAPDVAEDTTGEPIRAVEPGGDPTMASANQKMPELLYDAEESQPQLQQEDTKVSHDPFGMETQEIAPEEDGRQVEPDYDETKNDFGQK